MNDGKIYIVITDNPGKLNGEAPTSQKKETQDKTTGGDFIAHEFHNFIESQARQFLNYSISQVGLVTGNYQTQARIQDGIRAINIAKNIGLGIITGAKYGTPGAIAGGVIAAATQVINLGYQEVTANRQIERQSIEINILRQKSGLDLYTNGSR